MKTLGEWKEKPVLTGAKIILSKNSVDLTHSPCYLSQQRIYHLSERLSGPKHLFPQHHFTCSLRCLNSAPFDPALFISRQVSYSRAHLTLFHPGPTYPPLLPQRTALGLAWSNTVPPISTPQPLASLSLSAASGSCNWVKWGREGGGKKGEDGWECWKTFSMYPEGNRGLCS